MCRFNGNQRDEEKWRVKTLLAIPRLLRVLWNIAGTLVDAAQAGDDGVRESTAFIGRDDWPRARVQAAPKGASQKVLGSTIATSEVGLAWGKDGEQASQHRALRGSGVDGLPDKEWMAPRQ